MQTLRKFLIEESLEQREQRDLRIRSTRISNSTYQSTRVAQIEQEPIYQEGLEKLLINYARFARALKLIIFFTR